MSLENFNIFFFFFTLRKTRNFIYIRIRELELWIFLLPDFYKIWKTFILKVNSIFGNSNFSNFRGSKIGAKIPRKV